MSPLAVLLKNRLRLMRSWRRVLRDQSRFKTGFIILFAFGLLAALTIVFGRGFRFIDSLGQAGVFILPRLFALFFLGMSLMLVVSGAITAYTTLFRSPETYFLMYHPVRSGDITVYKSIESAALASWAFFFIIIPFTLAYAGHQNLSPMFAVWTLVMSIPFLLLCAGIGVLLTLIVCRLLPGRQRWLLATGLAVLAMTAARLLYFKTDPGDDETLFALGRLIPGFRLASNRFLPPAWITQGVLSLSRGQWSRGLMFWGMLASHALLLALLIERPGNRWFEFLWHRNATAGHRRRRGRMRAMPALESWLIGCAPATRAMVAKDLRTFLRDPAQWSQGLIFFGLLALYFSNLRTLQYHRLPDAWRSAIAFLNMFSLATVMSSLSSRFVFPQLSLEGQAFWLLGLAPVPRKRILTAKIISALAPTMFISLSLMLISSGMLRVTPEVRWIALGIGAATACAFTGMSVGLGAVFMDLRQPNPAAIVSGFGGTLNLVLSLGFMLASIVPFALVHRFEAVISAKLGWSQPAVAPWVWLVILTASATFIPLRLGYRELQQRDY